MILNEKHVYSFYNQEADLTHVFKYGIKLNDLEYLFDSFWKYITELKKKILH